MLELRSRSDSPGRVPWLPAILIAVTAILILTIPVAGQEPAAPAAQEEPEAPEIPEDALQRGTPRGTVQGFLEAVEEDDFERASEYLDLRFAVRRSGLDGPTLARQLNIVLERELWIDVRTLSADPDGTQGDGLADYRDELGRLRLDDREIVLYLERAPRDDGELVWMLSWDTVSQIEDLYEAFGYGPLIESIAEFLPEGSFLGIEFFKWIIALGSMIFAYVFFLVLSSIVLRITTRSDSLLRPRLRRVIRGPAAVLFVLTFGGLVLLELGVGSTGQRLAQAQTLTILVSIWLIFSLVNLTVEILATRLRAKGRESVTVLLRPIASSFKIIIGVGGLLLWLDNIGFDITAVLAGLGIGGLAVALALQKPLEDLFGAVTLFTQQAIRVNDFCRFSDKLGTVEEIGLRTTRIRTLENTILTVPNARFSQEYIENITARRMIRLHTFIQLQYDTTPEQLNTVLEGTRALLAAHAKIITDTARVRLKELGRHALLIEIHAYVSTTDYGDFMEVTEQVNLGVVACVHKSGASFAVPVFDAA